jgi:ectoine hydroxylase-related dioxygenase (phytanoyl-CoA dioxygenase family)
MKALLRDRRLQADFERQGFVVTPFLSSDQVSALLELYRQNIPESVSGLYESSRHNSYAVNRSINQAIREQVAAAGRDLFLPSKLYGGTFMVKSCADSTVLPLHQDWSVVEEKYRTFFVWCPLMDVSVVNGCLFVLPGSHLYFQSLRSGSYPSDRFVLPPASHRHVVDVPLKAGEAVFYSDDLFHGSYANNGSEDRIVATARVTQEEASLVYHHKADEQHVDVYQADEEFYLTHIDVLAKGRLPETARKLYRRPYQNAAVTNESLQSKIGQHFPSSGSAPKMKTLFKDAQLQAQFEKDGYAVIELLDPAQVDELKTFYRGLDNRPSSPSAFQVSLDNASPDFVRAVFDRLSGRVRGNVDRHFQDYKIFTASFVTKSSDRLGVVPPHQDWTFVDENEFWSATIWCPLVDVNEENGALGVIRGSHRFYDHVRPSPSPQYAPPFKDQLALIFPYLTIVKLKAGQAIVFDNRTMHASPPNTTPEVRVAFGIGITQKEAGLRHYYMLPGQDRPLMEGFEVNPEFFYSYNNARLSAMYQAGDKPKNLNSLGVFALAPRHYDSAELKERLLAAGNREDPALIARMAALFGANLNANYNANYVAASPGSQPSANQQKKLPFWKVYTPGNIVREIRYRLSK